MPFEKLHWIQLHKQIEGITSMQHNSIGVVKLRDTLQTA